MLLINRIVKHAKKVATLVYEKDPHNTNRGHFVVTPNPAQLPDTGGIYFLVSRKNGRRRIEKVGKTDGAKGLRGRMGGSGYQAWHNENAPSRDMSPKLWYDVMTTELKGQKLELYFKSFDQEVTIDALGEQVPVRLSPNAQLETHFRRQAKEQDHPLQLEQRKPNVGPSVRRR